MSKQETKMNSYSVQHLSYKTRNIDSNKNIDNAYGNDDSDHYDDDFEDSKNDILIKKNNSSIRPKPLNLNSNIIKASSKVNRSHYNGLSVERSQEDLSSNFENRSSNSVKGAAYKMTSYTRNSNKSYISKSKYTMSLLAEKLNMQPQPQLDKVQKCIERCTNLRAKASKTYDQEKKYNILLKENSVIRTSLKEMNEFLSQFVEHIKEAKLKRIHGMGYKYGCVWILVLSYFSFCFRMKLTTISFPFSSEIAKLES